VTLPSEGVESRPAPFPARVDSSSAAVYPRRIVFLPTSSRGVASSSGECRAIMPQIVPAANRRGVHSGARSRRARPLTPTASFLKIHFLIDGCSPCARSSREAPHPRLLVDGPVSGRVPMRVEFSVFVARGQPACDRSQSFSRELVAAPNRGAISSRVPAQDSVRGLPTAPGQQKRASRVAFRIITRASSPLADLSTIAPARRRLRRAAM